MWPEKRILPVVYRELKKYFEKRPPKGEAEMVTKDGKVVEIDDKKGIIKVSVLKDEKKKEEEEMEYKISPNIEILVKSWRRS